MDTSKSEDAATLAAAAEILRNRAGDLNLSAGAVEELSLTEADIARFDRNRIMVCMYLEATALVLRLDGGK